MLFGIVAAFLAGVARTLARTFNARLSSATGVMAGALWNHLIGTACAALAFLAWGAEVSGLMGLEVEPWAYLGGALGLVFVALSNLVAPRMSAFAMSVMAFLGQLGTGLLLDLLLGRELSPAKMLGAALVGAGLGLHGAGSRITREASADGGGR
jgi:transporter family-2 protein